MPKLTLGLDECIQIALENSFTLWDQQYSLELQERQLKRPGFLVLPHRPTA